MSLPPEHVPSPCVQICILDPASGLCRGCLRTVQEIADWVEMTADEKRATLVRVEQRRVGAGAR
jgi:predicted Fe-S protein YdhL (DUF1289 family)